MNIGRYISLAYKIECFKILNFQVFKLKKHLYKYCDQINMISNSNFNVTLTTLLFIQCIDSFMYCVCV